MPKVIDLPTVTSMANGDYLLAEKSTGGTEKITKGNMLGATLRGIALGTCVYPEITVPGNGGTVTIELRNNGNFHSGIIVGTVGGHGGIVLGFVLNTTSIFTVRDLMNNSAWTDKTGLAISVVDGTHIKFTNNYQYSTYLQVFAG